MRRVTNTALHLLPALVLNAVKESSENHIPIATEILAVTTEALNSDLRINEDKMKQKNYNALRELR